MAKLIHLSARKFQYLTADAVYIENLAGQFAAALGSDYHLVVGNKSPEQFKGINLLNLNFRTWGKSVWLYFWPPYIYYFFWLPFFLAKEKGADRVYFTSDQNILCLLIFWKKRLSLKFKICADLHLLYENWKDGYIAKNCDFIITTSKKLKNLIIERFKTEPKKILPVYGGVDLANYAETVDRMELRKKFVLPLDKNLIGYVGLFKTMGMEKGLKTMIEAATKLEIDKMMVFVGGKAEELTEYKNYADQLGVAEKCIFIGRVKPGEVAEFERAMDILVIPYPNRPHFRLYGFPMKIYEYMAAKKPIVYSALELAEEVMSDCGYAFKADDAGALAETLKYVADGKNQAAVQKKVEIAFAKLQQLTWRKKAENIIEFIT
ncbi:MAG: glycosyltransferase family 4 protein [Patescibacteria group bacterium]